MTVRSRQRFVKEFANWKIGVLKDLAKYHPDKLKSDELKGRIYYINRLYGKWEDGLMMTTEVMKLIADA